MRKISITEIKPKMIIRLPEDIGTERRNWIVLNVTKKDIKRGTNTDHTGLHGFGGLWYGRNPSKIKSYGKIDWFDDVTEVYVVSENIIGLSVNDIAKLVD